MSWTVKSTDDMDYWSYHQGPYPSGSSLLLRAMGRGIQRWRSSLSRNPKVEIFAELESKAGGVVR
eukprot:4204417-Pyramimonas_sp.AAC.1